MSDKLTIENPLGWRARALLAESEEERLRSEVEQLRAVVDAAKQYREARVATMTYGWNAHEQEAQAMQALMTALVVLDGD